jgi:hypothetical protein
VTIDIAFIRRGFKRIPKKSKGFFAGRREEAIGAVHPEVVGHAGSAAFRPLQRGGQAVRRNGKRFEPGEGEAA